MSLCISHHAEFRLTTSSDQSVCWMMNSMVQTRSKLPQLLNLFFHHYETFLPMTHSSIESKITITKGPWLDILAQTGTATCFFRFCFASTFSMPLDQHSDLLLTRDSRLSKKQAMKTCSRLPSRSDTIVRPDPSAVNKVQSRRSVSYPSDSLVLCRKTHLKSPLPVARRLPAGLKLIAMTEFL